jgi:hypothetical protein
VIVIDSYGLDVAIRADDVPFSCRVWLAVRNTGSEPVDRFVFRLHSELVVREIRNEAGAPLAHEASIEAYDLTYTGDIGVHSASLSRPIGPGEKRTLTAVYDGSFSPSNARGPSDYMRIDEEGAYLRGTGYSVWFPLQREWDWNTAATFAVVLDVPAAWRPLAFGELVSEERRGDRNVSRWTTGSPWPLLFCHLAAAEWDIAEGTAFRVYHRRTEKSRSAAVRYIEVGERLLSFYRTHYGSGVSTPTVFLAELCPYGGISAGNVIGIPTDRFADVADAVRSTEALELLAHELVHGFVIPAVVPGVPGSALLIEGFPSYFHSLALEEVLKGRFYERFVRRAWTSYHERRRAQGTPSSDLPPEVPLLELRDSDVGRYKDVFLLDDRFVVLLDRLRTLVGPEAFLRGTREFLDRHRAVPARFGDFVSALESVSGARLADFVERWFGSIDALPEAWAPGGGPA